MTVRSISFMVDSTYQALHSSFCVILSIADHFAKLKTHLLSLLSSVSLLKFFKWILDQFLTFLQLKQGSAPKPAIPGSDGTDGDCVKVITGGSGAAVAAVAPFSTPVDENHAPASHWPLIAFFGLALGTPWLLWKMTQSARTAEASAKTGRSCSSSSSSPDSPSSAPWSHGVGAHYVGKAEFDFRASSADEISFEKDDLLKVAPRHLQEASPKGWYLASKNGEDVGFVPANYVEILVKLDGKEQ